VTAPDHAADRLGAGLAELGRRIEAASRSVGEPVRWDWPEVLVERSRLRPLAPPGRTTASGAGRLLPCADGWVAVQLPRTEDVELLPAWLGLVDPKASMAHPFGDPTDPWPVVEAASRDAPARTLVEAGALVGLAVARLGERSCSPGVEVLRRRRRPPRGRVRVIDLSALWAGPLCGAVLAEAGADVVKVESCTRPDGARIGDPALFARLNRAKSARTVDVSVASGRRELAALVHDADVVVESTRPRALEQLGIVADDELRDPRGPGVWISITGYGRASPRIAFGDDAAVAGGLVRHTADGPQFRGDALADPLSGLAAAATALELLAAGHGGLVEVAMAGVAARHADPARPR
jgi:hypothetical protein